MTDNEWPLEADFSDIRPMTPEERKASLDRKEKNGVKSNDKQPVEKTDSRGRVIQGDGLVRTNNR